jgi:hypothetical protein
LRKCPYFLHCAVLKMQLYAHGRRT